METVLLYFLYALFYTEIIEVMDQNHLGSDHDNGEEYYYYI